MMYESLSIPHVLPPCDQENTPPQACNPEDVSTPRDCRSECRSERNTYVLAERHDNTNQENLQTSQEDSQKQGKTSSQKGGDENSQADALRKDQLSQLMQNKKLQKYTVKQLLHITKSGISFGNTFPGQVLDESLDIINKSNQNLVVEISLECENSDFQDTEEYVYSIRRSHLYDFNDKHCLIMAPYSSASFKVTLKAPAAKESCSNNGFLNIAIQGLKTSHKIALDSTIKVPKVTCPKALFHKKSGCKMMRLAAKEGKKQEFKIPFRNESDFPVSLDFSFYKNEESYKENGNMECCVNPGTLTIPANGSAYLNFVTKVRKTGKADDEKRTTEKRIVLGKVKDTNLVYSFFFCIETY